MRGSDRNERGRSGRIAGATLPASTSEWVRAAVDAAMDGVMVESGGSVVYTNAAYATLLGYRRPEEVIGRRVTELVAECDVERLARFAAARASGRAAPSSYDFAARRCDGSTIRLQASVAFVTAHGIPAIITTVRPAPIASPTNPARLAGPHDGLSAREREVMQLLLAGERPKEIAKRLGIAENTVATHRARLLGKLGLSDNRELIVYGLRHGLIDEL